MTWSIQFAPEALAQLIDLEQRIADAGAPITGARYVDAIAASYHRRTLCLMQSARRCRVRAYLDQGVRPHINLYKARYTNSVLAASTRLIGQDLLIYMNANDLRSVRAFLSDGTELGELEVQGV
ncbi:hypothetical protein [Paraburkholderia kirstenboschensis]|uniref:Uncharacterized protein n=1 Tax=Paraburkholderia kirstenboschensis TaxID=1245436 RepID=A0ABZ0E834_9BURK|nr:hypothetical protein [Paraburkholderia kirstenboschensis]WOD13414.1 hypothetical protein RW095_05085 [Paraburkholderia kirstenboschensis]